MRPFLRRFADLPLATRLPLIAGACAFLAAVLTTQVAVRALSADAERQAARLGQVYLDGLAAAVVPALAEGGEQALAAALGRALGFQQGVRERRLVVARPDGTLLAEAGLPEDPAFPVPLSRGIPGEAWLRGAGGGTAWAQRALPEAGGAVIAAKLDFSAAVERRRRLELGLLGLDLLLGGLAALLAGLLTRRALRPFVALAGGLDRAGAGDFAPLPAALRPAPRTEAGRLAEAFDLMTARLTERERLAARLAEQEQAAVLGRLAATVAHEVRNPLAGMLTAIDTARRFGADAEARAEALGLVERGLRQIEGVVQATLAMHRGEAAARPLAPRDLDDLRLLLAPEARRRGVALDWDMALDEPFPTDALAVRQALLNLLLNAVAASPAGGRVRFAARIEQGGELLVEVVDEGAGLPPEARARLDGGATAGQGLGLGVVMAQLGRLDGRIAVDSVAGGGTAIAIRLPPRSQEIEA
ncbi:ATP-binding protein [Roseomonas sp. HF4]|uniref:ATP-binding protein n=1 Tax=Roseomonas sp. HF4 TaxID=2562313 RepID=UPI0010C127BA|nr:HAMP domain-containing sensor histidine kinase [Roseomonas sp. HF4]